MSKKTYVLDTNVLLSDPSSIFSFDEHNVIIPMVVLEELDNHKSRPDEVGKNARQVSRTLDDMRTSTQGESLIKGVSLPSGGTLTVASIPEEAIKKLPPELRSIKVDNLIIAFMYSFKEGDESKGILVSKDINVRLKCDSLGIPCEDYLKMRVTADASEFYRGVEVVEIAEARVDQLFHDNALTLTKEELAGKQLYANEIVVVKNVVDGQTTKSGLGKYNLETGAIRPIENIKQAFGLFPKNKEQKFSLDLLFDKNISLLTLVGPSGTGKTLLALASALEQLTSIGNPDTAKYEKLIVSRPVQPVGKEIGFLPGTLEEKMEPWIAPIRDNLNFLMSNRTSSKKKQKNGAQGENDNTAYLELMQEKGIIEIEAITFIRGRSIPNAFIIIDEAQNLSMHELKTIITRAGEGTKIVLTGDIDQIDNVHVDVYTNGLTYAIEKFKDQAISGHVSLLKGERSALATIASQILLVTIQNCLTRPGNIPAVCVSTFGTLDLDRFMPSDRARYRKTYSSTRVSPVQVPPALVSANGIIVMMREYDKNRYRKNLLNEHSSFANAEIPIEVIPIDPPPAFLPTDLGSGCRVWLRKTLPSPVRYQDSARTTQVTSAGQEVGSWTDSSGLNNHGTATLFARPLESASRTGAIFDGVDDAINADMLAAYPADFFVGMVCTPAILPVGFMRFLERAPNGSGVYIGTNGVANQICAFIAGVQSINVPMSLARHAIALERRATTGNLYIDGSLVATWSVPSTAILDGITYIGGPDGGGPFFSGTIEEVVIARLTSGEHGGVESANLRSYLGTV